MTTRDKGITLPASSDRFDVKDFGAVGDGVADDTVAIQSAFDATIQVGVVPGVSSMVYFSPGFYKTTAPIQIPPGASFMGVGQGSILLPDNCNCFEFQASSYVGARTFSNIFIFGQNCQNRIGIRCNLDSGIGQRVTGCTFENIYISWFGTSAWLRGMWFSDWITCYFLNAFKSCVISGQNVKVLFYGCKFDRGNGVLTGVGKSTGFSMEANGINRAEDIVLNNCLVYGYQIQINIDSVLYFAILACDIDNVLETGVLIAAVGGGGVIRDCWFGMPGLVPAPVPQIGIDLSNLGAPRNSNITIDNNYMEYHTVPLDPGSSGVKVGSNQNNIVIQNNCMLAHANGVYVNGGANCKILNNIFDTITSSIFIAFSDKVYIEGNFLGKPITTHVSSYRVNYGYNMGVQTTKCIGTVSFGAGSTIEDKSWVALGIEPVINIAPSFHKATIFMNDTLPFDRGNLRGFLKPDGSGIIFKCTTANPSAVPATFQLECYTGA